VEPRRNTPETSTTSSILEKLKIQWVKDGKSKDYLYGTEETIAAPIAVVWKVACAVDEYKRISKGVVIACAPKGVAENNPISFEVKDMPKSDETICVVNNDDFLLGWKRVLPMNSGTTERYQYLEKINEETTKSYIRLKIPAGMIGKMTDWMYKTKINAAFDALHKGIKEEAEVEHRAFKR